MSEIQYWWLIALPVFFGLGWLAARIDIKQVLSETRSLPAAYFRGLNYLLHGETNKADRVGFKVEEGKKIRVFKSTQKAVDA